MFTATLAKIEELDQQAMETAQVRLDNLTKPLGALGVLEAIAKQLAGIYRNPQPQVKAKAVVVMAGDHGVVEEGVSAFPQEVTCQMIANFEQGGAGINVLARHQGARVVVVDVGVNTDQPLPGVINLKVRQGTRNMTKEPAMTNQEAIQAIEAGITIANQLVGEGVNLLATGEMGIANTTPSSAILAVFGGFEAQAVTGTGTGISQASFQKKVQAIQNAITLNQPNPNDALDVLTKVGGLEIAGLVGLILGAAANRVPVVIDGFISTAAALVASRLCPLSKAYMIASHASMEPGHAKLLELLGLKPIIYLDMRLGEGTGAVLGMGIIEAACKIINEMATFEAAGVQAKLDS